MTHGIIGGSIQKRGYSFWFGLFMGMLPDFVGLGGFLGWTPYNVSHSLIALFVVCFFCKSLWDDYWYALPYGLHIFMDIFTHHTGTYNLFYVPFLWKSYDFIGYRGLDWWSEGIYIELGTAALALILLSFYIRRKGN